MPRERSRGYGEAEEMEEQEGMGAETLGLEWGDRDRERLIQELQDELLQRVETALRRQPRRRSGRMGRRQDGPYDGNYGDSRRGERGGALRPGAGYRSYSQARAQARREVLAGLRRARADQERLRRNPYAGLGDAIVDEVLEQAEEYGLTPMELAQVLEMEMGGWSTRLRGFLTSRDGKYLLAGALGTILLMAAGPSLAKALRPVLRESISGFLALSDQVQGLVGRAQEGIKDIVAEAQYQHHQEQGKGMVGDLPAGAAGSAGAVGAAGALGAAEGTEAAQTTGAAGGGRPTGATSAQVPGPGPAAGSGAGRGAGPGETQTSGSPPGGRLSDLAGDGATGADGPASLGRARPDGAVPPAWMLPQGQEPGPEAQPSLEDEAGDLGK